MAFLYKYLFYRIGYAFCRVFNTAFSPHYISIFTIIGIILFVVAVFKLDEFLIANNLPTDDSVYDPIFGTIASIYFLWHLILGIINMKNSRTITKAQLCETQLNAQSNPIDRIDFTEMAKQYEAQLDAQLNANTRTNLGETAQNE